MQKKKFHLSIVGLLSLGYFITIIIGTLLLLLPISNNTQDKIHWYDALFTATSATCVTGLIPFPTTSWTKFGQIVIVCLIQIGGLGFMTIISLIFMIFKKNIGIYNRTASVKQWRHLMPSIMEYFILYQPFVMPVLIYLEYH